MLQVKQSRLERPQVKKNITVSNLFLKSDLNQTGKSAQYQYSLWARTEDYRTALNANGY